LLNDQSFQQETKMTVVYCRSVKQ